VGYATGDGGESDEHMTSSASIIVDGKKAVIFDLFHTLVSLQAAWGDRLPRVHEILGVSREAWVGQLGAKLHDLYVGKCLDAFEAVSEMARAIDPAIPDETIKKAVESITETFAGALIRVPVETEEVLASLKARGKRLGLVSNASVMEIAAWDRSPIAPLFDSALFSCFTGYVKPDRKMYEMSMDALDVTPEQCVFVGDGGSEELAGARDLGICAIMVAGMIRDVWPEKIEERRRHADLMIEHLRELT
jgi:putative hydrolase of the HAD superfamily